MIRNNTLVRLLAMLLFGLAAAAGPAFAQGDVPIMEQISLTTQQREQIKNLTDQFARETEPLRNDIRRLVEEEKRLKSGATTSETALRRTLKERADKEIELSIILTRFHEKVESLLTATQRRKLDELKKQNHR